MHGQFQLKRGTTSVALLLQNRSDDNTTKLIFRQSQHDRLNSQTRVATSNAINAIDTEPDFFIDTTASSFNFREQSNSMNIIMQHRVTIIYIPFKEK